MNHISQGEIIPRVVFLLTDGQFTDQGKILDLIDQHVPHSSVHTIGIGSDVGEHDLLNIATHGKGQALIVKNMHGSSLQARIIELLQTAMFGTPSVTLDFGVPVKLAALGIIPDDIGSVNEYSEKIELRLVPNRKYTFYGFMKSKPTSALQMTTSGTTTPLPTPKHVEGAGLHTIACGALISHLKMSKLGNSIASITTLSLTFNVLSPYTAFVLTEIKNTAVPSYATMITAGLDLTVPVPENPVIEEEPIEEKPPVIHFTIEIPHYEYQSSAQLNEELNSKFNVQIDDQEEYQDVPPSVLDSKPELREKIAKSEPLEYTEQKELGKLFDDHIMNKRAIQRMLKMRRNEEEELLAATHKKEHVDKIAEITGVMKKLSTDIEALYNQYAAIISSYKPYNTSVALNWTDISLKSEVLVSKLTLAPKAEDLIDISNYNSKDYNILKMEVDHQYAAMQNMFRTELSPIHADALKLAEEYSGFCRFVLKDIPKAVKIGKEAFDGAISELDTLSEDGYKDSTVLMQILRDQLTEMTGDDNNNAETRGSYIGASNMTNKTVANKVIMDKVLFMQHPEGYWHLNEVLNVLNISSEKFAEFVGKEFDKFSESIWATVFVLAWLNEKFAEHLNEFIMISVKAEQYLEENNALDLIQRFNWSKLLAQC